MCRSTQYWNILPNHILGENKTSSLYPSAKRKLLIKCCSFIGIQSGLYWVKIKLLFPYLWLSSTVGRHAQPTRWHISWVLFKRSFTVLRYRNVYGYSFSLVILQQYIMHLVSWTYICYRNLCHTQVHINKWLLIGNCCFSA